MTAARRPGAVADVLVATQEDVQVLLGAPPGACRTIRDEDVDARVALWNDIPEYGAARLVSAGPLLVKVLRSVNIDADVSMFPAAHAQKVFCYVLDALFVIDDDSITITSDELRSIFDETVSVRSPISTVFPVKAAERLPTGSKLVKVVRAEIQALGLQEADTSLFACSSDVRSLLSTRTMPMLKHLVKRTRINPTPLQECLHVFIGASGAGKTIRMLQVAFNEANAHAAVYCRLPSLFSCQEIRDLNATPQRQGERDPMVRSRLLTFLKDNYQEAGTVALLVDECGACPNFVCSMAEQYSAIRRCARAQHIDLVIIAGGAGAASRNVFHPCVKRVIRLQAPPNLQQELEDECPWLKLLNKGKAAKWYKAMMLNARAATCLARTFEDLGSWFASSEIGTAEWVAPAVLLNAARCFISMTNLSHCGNDALQQIHLRAARIATTSIESNLNGADLDLIRWWGILTDESASEFRDPHEKRYKMDAGIHVVLLLCCGGLAGALADEDGEFEAEALVWLRWCIAIRDAAEPCDEHTHFGSIFGCAVTSSSFVAPMADAVKNSQAYPAAHVWRRQHTSDRRSRTVRTFVLTQRIDPDFMKTLPAKLGHDVATQFQKGQITSLCDLAIALSESKDYHPTKENKDALPFALMQAVLDTSDDVWIFQNAPGAEFADIIVVWKTAVWLIRVKHCGNPTYMYQKWQNFNDEQIYNDEHKMGSGTVEADCAACVSATTVSFLTSNGLGGFCRANTVFRDSLYRHITERVIAPADRLATFKSLAPGAADTLDEPVKLVRFLFGAREVRRAHLVFSDEYPPQRVAPLPDGIVLNTIWSDSLLRNVVHLGEAESLEVAPPPMPTSTPTPLPTSATHTGNRMSGFANIGNSCYAGAVLSLLLQDSTIRNAALKLRSSRSSDNNGLLGAHVHAALCTIIDECQRNAGTLEPLEQSKELEDSAFLDGEQHDAHDFLVALFTQIRIEELMIHARPQELPTGLPTIPAGEEQESGGELRKRGREDTAPASSDPCSQTPCDDAGASLQKGRKGEESALPNAETADLSTHTCCLSQLVEGQVIETMVCRHCRRSRSTVEPFTCLSVPCMRTVKKSAVAFFQEEDVSDFVCGECHHSGTQCKKKTGFASLPAKLFIHLKRFSVETGKKNDVPVSVSETLRLRETTPDGAHVTCNYSLTGVVQHHGNSVKAGHCTARVLCDDHQWYQIDDDVVSTTTAPDRASNSYILLYTRGQ